MRNASSQLSVGKKEWQLKKKEKKKENANIGSLEHEQQNFW